jgi:L-threonylcarbamoyladenylate synthase
MTERLPPDPQGIARAATLLQAGALVAMPTETVYGLAGDARNSDAVAKIYAAKGRPGFNPLIVHVEGLEAARRIARFCPQAEAMARAFWPGPLTMVLPLREDAGISPLVTAGLNTVALRLPAHPLARALLRASSLALAAPSANPSGRISPTTADHVFDGLNGRIAAVLDGGPCPVGVESTIIGFDPPRLLRPGGIGVEDVTAILGPLCAGGNATRPDAPGQLLSHYAPAAALRLNVTTPEPDEVFISFGPTRTAQALTLSPTADLAEAAAALFSTLRHADALAGPLGRIAVAPIPMTGLGLAINDRLTRAAAPRS